MSLDVHLKMRQPANLQREQRTAIFVRKNGQTREISRDEWDAMHPGFEPVSVIVDEDDSVVFSANVTHNLGPMAKEAGLYEYLWGPDELGIAKASELIEPIAAGLERLESDPSRFKALDPLNGWGSYAMFVPWVRNYLSACREYPDADVEVSR